MENFETSVKQVDVLPMVKYYMDQLQLFDLFKKYVPATPDSLTEHAESLCVLTANIICDNKPLYKVREWLVQYSDGLFDKPVEANLFNDDRLARSLSGLFQADRNSLMTEVSSNAITAHNLMTNDIHNDSTTVTFMGNYRSQDPEAVKLKRGHNKDFHPDCKQVVFGLNITSDGHVPLSYKLFDGNTTDDVTHIPNWNGLRSLLEKEDFIYIADCKLCNFNNMNHISQNGGFFITVVPNDRKEVKEFTKHLKTSNIQFEDAYTVNSSHRKGKKNTFKTYEAEKTKNGFRIIWIHSSLKQEDDQSRRQKKIDKAIKELKALIPKLNAYHLKTKSEIKDAIDRICKGVDNFLDVKILTHRKQIKVKVSPGRPSYKTVYKNKWEFKYSIQWELNEQVLLEVSRTDGIFPMITNTDLEACEVLKKYKDQPFLEKRMYTKKSVLEVAPVFLKKEKRIEAMLALFFIALMIVSLIERRIRMNMAKENIDKLPILPQAMNTKKPTWNNIRYFFRNVLYSRIFRDGICIQAIVNGLSELHKQVIRLLEVPDTIYENLQTKWWQFKCT